MKYLMSLILVMGLAGVSATQAAECTARVKDVSRSIEVAKSFRGTDAELKLAGYGFSILVDGTTTSLAIQKPVSAAGQVPEEISNFVVTPAPKTPPVSLNISQPDGTQVSLSCQF